MNFYDMYLDIIKQVSNFETKEEQFENMFLLTCLLIYNLSSQGRDLDTILNLLQEFDYKKNFGEEE